MQSDQKHETVQMRRSSYAVTKNAANIFTTQFGTEPKSSEYVRNEAEFLKQWSVWVAVRGFDWMFWFAANGLWASGEQGSPL
jgi:hypothetical protein